MIASERENTGFGVCIVHGVYVDEENTNTIKPNSPNYPMLDQPNLLIY